jgi:AsmA family protein
VRWWMLPLGLVGLVLLAIVVGVVLLTIQDVEQQKEFITKKISEKTGRELVIAGDFELSISFSPSITADDITFENAAWGSRAEMLKLGHVEAEVELFPMLVGDIRVKRLILEDLDVLAESNEDGVGNWQFGERKKPEGDEESEGGGDLPVIEDLRINNALLRYQDGQTGERHVVMISHAEGSSQEGEDVAFALEGIWNNSPIDASGTVGAGDENVPLALSIEMFGAETKINGTVGDPEEFEDVSLDIRIAGERLSDLNVVAGSFPPIGPYTVQAHLSDGEDDSFILDNFHARIAESDLAGTLTLFKDERPRLTANLTSSLLDLDVLLTENKAAGTAEAQDAGGGGEGSAVQQDSTAPRIFPDEKLDLAALNEADADIALSISDLRYGGLSLRDAVLGVKLAGGVLTLDPLRARLADGSLGGTLELHSQSQPPKLRTKLNLSAVDLAAIRPLFDLSEVVSGPLDLDVSLTGQGRTAHEIAATLNGRVDMLIGAGTIPNEYVDLIAADLLRFIVPGSAETDGARLNCFVARFAIKNGIAVNEALLFDTALTTTAGKGTIDLGREVADLTVVPRPKDPALFSLAIPVVVDGPLTDLSYDLKKEDALLGLAGSVLGYALLGPFGVLIPLVSAGTGDENSCVTALEQPAEEARPANQAPETPDEAVEGIVDDIMDIFD